MSDTNVCAVAVRSGGDTWENVVPSVCNLQHTLCRADWGDEKDMKWLKGPAIPRDKCAGATAKTVPASLPKLRALLRQCPNVVILSLGDLDLPPKDMGFFVASELSRLAPRLEVLDLSCCCIEKVTDLHAMLESLPHLRIFLFSGDGGVGDGDDDFYYVGMARHPSLQSVRLQPDVSDQMTDVEALLCACPAIRAIDFTECGGYCGQRSILVDIEALRQEVLGQKELTAAPVTRIVQGGRTPAVSYAGRVTHIFATMNQLHEHGPEDWIINALDAKAWKNHGEERY
jgi:hypothetical protein